MQYRWADRVCWVVSVVLLFGSLPLVAQEKEKAKEPPQDSLNRDYGADLPRIAPKEPKEAMATFTVAPGFRLEQVATEPLVADPTAIAFDENGRLFVVEMRGYSEERDENISRIRLLEDTDGDGRFDKSSIFVDKLAWPTAVHCWEGGILVADAPDIFYFKDTNGDGKSDERRVLFTGFGRSNVQGLVNTFSWGLDNRIYGATSSSGADIVSSNDPNGKPLALRGRDFAIEPRAMKMSAVSGGAQHGLSINNWGERFVSSNSDHIQQVMYEDRYLARNPYLAAPSPRRSIAADGPQADVFRTSPIEAWRIIRTRLRVSGIVKGAVEGGGRPAGYFTGATGVTIYRGDSWPVEWRGLAIVGDVGSNLVHRKKLTPEGVGYVATRIDEKSEFVSSSDNWFRPVQFANAPDGTLYILDMYREVIEHPASIPPLLKKHIDLTSGRDRGRIYRVVTEGFKQRPLPKLGSASLEELVQTLDHANGWHRDTAARLIYERQDAKAAPLLSKQFAETKLPEGRIVILHSLAGLNALTEADLLKGLSDEHPRVREQAVRLAESSVASSNVRARLLQMVADDDLHVRYQLAFSLGELPASQRVKPLVALAKRDGSDGYVRVAILSSLGEGAGQALSELAADEAVRNSAAGKEMLRSLAAQIGRQQRPEDIASVLQTLGKLPPNAGATLQLLVQTLAAKVDSPFGKQIAAATGGKAAELMQSMLAAAQQAAVDEDRKLPARVAAVQQLRLGQFEPQQELFTALLEPTQPADIQSAALASLSALDAPQIAPLIVGQYAVFSPRLKSQATDVLLSRPAWALVLLDAIATGKVSMGDLEPGRLKLLAEGKNEKLAARAKELLGKTQLSRRGDVVAAYRETLEMKGDAARGRVTFKKICAACHKLEGVGTDIGPNLAAMKARGSEAILLNVLDPNREVNPQYLNYALITTDGRTLAGIIAAETATSVTLRRAENQSDTVLRIEIDQLKSTGQSLMPEGMEKQIDKQAMADLLELLRTAE